MSVEFIPTLMENFIRDCQKKNISKEERSLIIKELCKLKKCSQRQLAKELNIPYSTIHDWVSLRQDNTGEDIHLSFTNFLRKIKSLDSNKFTDWGRLEQIRDEINRILLKRGLK